MWDGCLEILITSATQLHKTSNLKMSLTAYPNLATYVKLQACDVTSCRMIDIFCHLRRTCCLYQQGWWRDELLGICCYYIQGRNGVGRTLSVPDRCRRQQVTLKGLYMLVSVKTKRFLTQTKFIFVVTEFKSCLFLHISFIYNVFSVSMRDPLDVQISAVRLNYRAVRVFRLNVSAIF